MKNLLIPDRKTIDMTAFVFRFLFAICLFYASVNSYAQPAARLAVRKELQTDSSKVRPAKFNREALESYADQKEFQYDNVAARDLSLWDRFWMWFWWLISKLFQGAASNPLSRYFFIGLGIAILSYIIIKIAGSENIFSRKPKETILPYDVLNENIHEINYEKEIQNLINQKKYRLAVRLLYLRTLKKLSDADIIHWQPEKTNYNYLTEISRPELKSGFGLLTHQFDYIWYGDFPIDAQKFEPINQSFNQFNAQIR